MIQDQVIPRGSNPAFREGRNSYMRFSRTVEVAGCAVAMLFGMGLAEAAPAQTSLNHIPRAVGQSRRSGPVFEMSRLNLAIGLPLRNRAELDRLVEQISDPS